MILVTGGSGKLATALQAYLPDAAFLSHQSLDVTDPIQCRDAVDAYQPSLVLHCGAATHHAEPYDVYERVNVRGTVNILRAARKVDARFVYLSTDYVYPGGTG